MQGAFGECCVARASHDNRCLCVLQGSTLDAFRLTRAVIVRMHVDVPSTRCRTYCRQWKSCQAWRETVLMGCLARIEMSLIGPARRHQGAHRKPRRDRVPRGARGAGAELHARGGVHRGGRAVPARADGGGEGEGKTLPHAAAMRSNSPGSCLRGAVMGKMRSCSLALACASDRYVPA